ncbi:MAG: NUDIX hydrolase [Armatimonadota bacterium]|nr:NUDIX hydrolase [Armatimonadota bacterium]MDR5703120.1 NUDIX hydrolase [Armatimonadota bacterium]MDR7435572.1 NUDIX hydrolase [Armatimonadota bacterium]
MSEPVERTIRVQRIYDGQVVGLRVEEVELPSGRRTIREIVEHRGAVGIVPVTQHGDVLLVRQYRKAVDQWLVEIPAGTIEPGEEIEACLERELAEEVGVRAGRYKKLVTFFPSPGFLTEVLHIYLAMDLTPHVVDREEEELQVIQVPLAQAKEMVHRGEIKDAKSIIGILLAADLVGA